MLLYRALLYCYPAAFRHEYGDQMLLVFSEQLRETRGAAQRARLWLRHLPAQRASRLDPMAALRQE